ncbi:hypothetical protein N7450_006228 [Penicillium hetheringtonii]|uniref:Uncharacterized protein n=1 Tax=Penicillium hetheringtonii TaxID=911720 RepID=A0AAD6DLH4_9EURO|nr:hypothetical protein N7450_006228 [Penicillium hetheringtonii]
MHGTNLSIELVSSTGDEANAKDNVETYRSGTWTAQLKSFLRWVITPLGACITIYGLNLIAWGGMLFLLMCNAAPAMCHPDCNSLNSPRRIWIEIDSQILNALFCVTGFGLAPWRLRDLYHWVSWRLCFWGNVKWKGLSSLAEIHANWFVRSTQGKFLPTKADDQPIGRSTPLWKMDMVVWGNMLNTIFQVCLATCMWAMNRFNRPSWATGLFVGLACVAAGIPGIIMWLEKRSMKKASEHPGALLVVPKGALPVPGISSSGNGGYLLVN